MLLNEINIINNKLYLCRYLLQYWLLLNKVVEVGRMLVVAVVAVVAVVLVLVLLVMVMLVAIS